MGNHLSTAFRKGITKLHQPFSAQEIGSASLPGADGVMKSSMPGSRRFKMG